MLTSQVLALSTENDTVLQRRPRKPSGMTTSFPSSSNLPTPSSPPAWSISGQGKGLVSRSVGKPMSGLQQHYCEPKRFYKFPF